MSRLSELQLALYFTKGVSLTTWHSSGMLEREVALYRALRPHVKKITFVTYGDERDLALRSELGDIDIICNHERLSDTAYYRRLMEVPPVDPTRPAILKSNQIWGADIPVRVGHQSGIRCITRCGYLFSDFMQRQYGAESTEAEQARSLENMLFKLSDRVVVTTPAMIKVVLQNQVPREKAMIIPNYVMVDVFRPDPDVTVKPDQVCFVGRLNDQKNPFSLIAAFKDLNARLVMVGSGGLKIRLKREIRKQQLPVTLLGNLPHRDLPRILNESAIFVLPSHYEGHPKTLLEAMSCGRPIVAADAPGIREELRHLDTGYLCGTDEASIRSALETLLSDREAGEAMGRRARDYIMEHYALERIVEMELDLYRELLGETPVKR